MIYVAFAGGFVCGLVGAGAYFLWRLARLECSLMELVEALARQSGECQPLPPRRFETMHDED